MTDYVERRRAYVSQVRSSFETGADAGEPFDREEPQRGRAGGQLRFLVALLLFVGIPLPGTGAWTGTLAASFLDMDFKSSIIAVMLGVMLAGIIMGLASAGLLGAVSALFAV